MSDRAPCLGCDFPFRCRAIGYGQRPCDVPLPRVDYRAENSYIPRPRSDFEWDDSVGPIWRAHDERMAGITDRWTIERRYLSPKEATIYGVDWARGPDRGYVAVWPGPGAPAPAVKPPLGRIRVTPKSEIHRQPRAIDMPRVEAERRLEAIRRHNRQQRRVLDAMMRPDPFFSPPGGTMDRDSIASTRPADEDRPRRVREGAGVHRGSVGPSLEFAEGTRFPFAIHYDRLSWPVLALRLASGTVIVKVGCQSGTLEEWRPGGRLRELIPDVMAEYPVDEMLDLVEVAFSWDGAGYVSTVLLEEMMRHAAARLARLDARLQKRKADEDLVETDYEIVDGNTPEQELELARERLNRTADDHARELENVRIWEARVAGERRQRDVERSRRDVNEAPEPARGDSDRGRTFPVEVEPPEASTRRQPPPRGPREPAGEF